MLTGSKFYNNSSFWFLVIAIFVRLNPYIAELSYIMLAVYANFGKSQAIKALVLTYFFTMINSSIAPNIPLISLLRYLVIFAAFLSVFLRTSFLKFDHFSLFTIGFVIFIIIHSILFSQFPDVSIFKITSWIIVVITLLKAWSGLNELDYNELQNWIVKSLLVFALLSLPTIFIPEIGFARNTMGFQGLLNHPQSFGVTIALLTAILLGELIGQSRPSWSLIITVILLFWMILISQTRTAGLGLFLALGITLLFFFIFGFLKKKSYLPIFKSKRLFIVFFISVLLLIIFSKEIFVFFNTFISKTEVGLTSIIEIYKISRGVLFEPMIENINKNFMTGIGFGVASDPLDMIIQRDPFLNLPISAPTEKGIVFIMMMEELGFFGFILFIIWISIIFIKAINNGLKAVILVVTIFLLNLGEAVLFSPGGLGLLVLILLTSAVTKPTLSPNLPKLAHSKN